MKTLCKLSSFKMTPEKESCCSSKLAASWIAVIFMAFRSIVVSLLFYHNEQCKDEAYFLLRILLELYCIGDILLLLGLAKKIQALVLLWIMMALIFLILNIMAVFMFDYYPEHFDGARGLIVQLILCTIMVHTMAIMVVAHAHHVIKKSE